MAEYFSKALTRRRLLLKAIFSFTVYVCHINRTMNAEVCLQEFGLDATMQCQKCSGNLQMKFGPYRFSPFAKPDIADINCTVNKPANISLFFDQRLKPFQEDTVDLIAAGEVNGIQVQRLNNGCTHTLQFVKTLASACQFGRVTCVAVTDQNETISKSNEIAQVNQYHAAPFQLNLEDPAQRKSNQTIIGTSANLTCSYISKPGTFFGDPVFTFWRFGPEGNIIEIADSKEKPKKYENQGKVDEVPFDDYLRKYTRRLYFRRIDASFGSTYFCQVFLPSKQCKIQKQLVITTRPCMAGYYCSRDSSKETPCKAGTYSNVTGLFNSSGCRSCPMNSYCTSGSAAPIRCPMQPFFPAIDQEIKIFEGKRSVDDCRRCPVEPCDKNPDTCTLICSKRRHMGIFGQKTSISCSLSNGKLLRNLTWYKGNKTIANDLLHTISQDENAFILTIKEMSVEHIGNYSCGAFENVMGNRIYTTTLLVGSTRPAEIHANDGSDIAFPLSLSISIAVLLVILIAVAVRWRLSSRPDARRFIQPPEDPNHSFDVFICYSNADKVWVRKTLLPKLQSFNLRVCIDFQDFCPGSFIIENIADAISSSRKTVAVLSPDFVSSAWCQKELMMALTRIEAKHSVIPVMYRECQVPRFLYQRTYLDWCNEDVRGTFWEQLLRTINDGYVLDPDFDFTTDKNVIQLEEKLG